MTNVTDIFLGVEDRADVLTEILHGGRPAPGTTLVALVDRSTLAVLQVREFPTPEPIMNGEYFDDGYIYRLNGTLRDLALAIAPPRTWVGDRWSPMTGELITVVCRDGTPTITPVETQFYFGWRFSNHITAALDGDVYVVTPNGWVALFGEWSGALPALHAP